MKLYYSPGACSLAAHIALCEAGVTFSLDKVDLKTKHYSGGDFNTVNPNGYVPFLELDDGQKLGEDAAILQYVADRAPDKKLAPAQASFERYRLQEWLNFIATEIHKRFSPLFGADSLVPNPEGNQQLKAAFKEGLIRRLGYVADRLEGKPFLMGENFTVADAYLFTVLRWAPAFGIELEQWPALKAYFERVRTRPKVREALQAEGLRAT
jgi:glutathione S-transferase